MRAIQKSLVLAATSALLASGAAFAGDNSMSPFYGDSWADLQAHTPNMPQGPNQALQDRADAQAAWSHARDNAHAMAQRWRDEISHMWHHDDHVPPAG